MALNAQLLNRGYTHIFIGIYLDRNMKHYISQQQNGSQGTENVLNLPVESLRLKRVQILVFLSAAGTVGYGISLSKHVVSC